MAMKMLKVLVLIGLILLPSISAIEDGNRSKQYHEYLYFSESIYKKTHK